MGGTFKSVRSTSAHVEMHPSMLYAKNCVAPCSAAEWPMVEPGCTAGWIVKAASEEREGPARRLPLGREGGAALRRRRRPGGGGGDCWRTDQGHQDRFGNGGCVEYSKGRGLGGVL
jgi:hypothetical protein